MRRCLTISDNAHLTYMLSMQGCNTLEALLFDLGGVLLDFRGVESVHALSRGQVSAEQFSAFWSQSRWAERLHCGRCTPEEFAAGAVGEFALAIDPADFLLEFRTWLRGPYPGAFELLAELRGRFQLACLSNTNALDVRRMRDELKLDHRFDYCFFSNEMGVRKPSRYCYRMVLERLRTAPERVAFFDDSAEYVKGAIDAGLIAYQCDGIVGLRQTLRALGVIEAG
jgi:HAD superfamily hydrolase (TIGR01509 family)